MWNILKRKTEYVDFNHYKKDIEAKALIAWQNDTRKRSLANIERPIKTAERQNNQRIRENYQKQLNLIVRPY